MDPSIASVLRDVSKQYGQGSAMVMSEQDIIPIERVHSGSLNLDLAIGGGVPTGRIFEIYGPESAGKTTVCTLIAAQFQRQYPEKYVYFSDLEHAFNPIIAQQYGIDMSRFILSQPDNAEQALDMVEAFIRSGSVSLCIVDSVSALMPEAEEKGSIGDQQIGLQARLLSKTMRKLVGPANKKNCSVIFINQIREKVGVMYGNPETTSGGRALKFYSSIRMNVRAGERLTEGAKDNVIGHVINVKIEKNKTAQPFKTGSFSLYYGKGVDTVSEVVDIGLLVGFIHKAGSYVQLKDENGEVVVRNGTKMSQYKSDLVDYLRVNQDLYEHFKNIVLGRETLNMDILKGNQNIAEE